MFSRAQINEGIWWSGGSHGPGAPSKRYRARTAMRIAGRTRPRPELRRADTSAPSKVRQNMSRSVKRAAPGLTIWSAGSI